MPLNEQRAVANVRERRRTLKLNQAYKHLQSIIPKEPSDKMSKIHTLKLALTYIDFLNDLLKESEGAAGRQVTCARRQMVVASSPGGTNSNSPNAKLADNDDHDDQHDQQQQQHHLQHQQHQQQQNRRRARTSARDVDDAVGDDEFQHRSKRVKSSGGAQVVSPTVATCYATPPTTTTCNPHIPSPPLHHLSQPPVGGFHYDHGHSFETSYTSPMSLLSSSSSSCSPLSSSLSFVAPDSSSYYQCGDDGGGRNLQSHGGDIDAHLRNAFREYRSGKKINYL